MVIENINLDFNLNKIDRRKNYFIEEIKQRDLMSSKNKNVSAAINYIGQLLILVSSITRRVSVSPCFICRYSDRYCKFCSRT